MVINIRSSTTKAFNVYHLYKITLFEQKLELAGLGTIDFKNFLFIDVLSYFCHRHQGGIKIF